VQTKPEVTTDLLLMIAGAAGAVASTAAVAIETMRQQEGQSMAGLTAAEKFPFLGDVSRYHIVGWDRAPLQMVEAVAHHKVLPPPYWEPHQEALSQIPIRPAPSEAQPLGRQVETIQADMAAFQALFPQAKAVLINLLPAACGLTLSDRYHDLDDLMHTVPSGLPDMAYAAAAVLSGIPVVNFTPNTVEISALCREAERRAVPLAGRDGKSGQTYLKVVLASAFKARNLMVEGWYSLNILGNADGKNLMDPDRACGKLQNKTRLLDDILGYPVGGHTYGESTHKVHIDYYPPRGDAKEAWDVIDFSGLLGLPMSLRLNLQGRDSILAAPMVIDLARWAAALHMAGMGGPIADLGFFFKKPVGPNAPITFEDQLGALDRLERQITERVKT
jgi:myo-inositol-1-phosphate synthase